MILLEQLADEAIRLRQAEVSRADFLSDSIRAEHQASLLASWAFRFPALDDLGVRRETALGEMEGEGTTPGPGCTVRVATVQLHAHPAPRMPWTYWISRSTDDTRHGVAWLSSGMDTTEPGRYVAVDTTGLVRGHVEGDTLAEAVLHLADALARAEQVQRAAKRGDVQ